jgi:hypothetical protein
MHIALGHSLLPVYSILTCITSHPHHHYYHCMVAYHTHDLPYVHATILFASLTRACNLSKTLLAVGGPFACIITAPCK